MRLLLLIFVFIGVKAQFSNWGRFDDDEDEEKKFECRYQQRDRHEAGKCKNHYYICDNKKKTITMHCPEGFVYYDDMCKYKEESPECPEYKSDLNLYKSKQKNTICKQKIDGHYHFPCEITHFSCKNGNVTWHQCPSGHSYNPNACSKDKCIKKENDARCGGKEDGMGCSNAPKTEVQTLGNSKKEFSCQYKRDGHYPAGRCSNHFFICANFKQIITHCPEGMVFRYRQCRFKRDIKDCPEYKTDSELFHSKNETERNSICEIRGDGINFFPCENDYYLCEDGKTIWMNCPPGEVYDTWGCLKRIHHEDCSEFVDYRVWSDIDPYGDWNEKRLQHADSEFFTEE